MSRTNKTKELLAQSLTELMVTTPLEKISVNDIVEHAGVGRNTFYYHFEDKFDLVNWYFQSGATQFLVTRGHYASWSTLLTDLEEYLLQNKTFYVNALAYTGQNCLQEYVFHYLSEMFGQRLLSLVPSATERDCQFTGNFLSGAMVGLLLPWVRNGMPPLNQADLDHGLRTLCSCNLAVLLGYGIDPSALYYKQCFQGAFSPLFYINNKRKPAAFPFISAGKLPVLFILQFSQNSAGKFSPPGCTGPVPFWG